MRVRLSRALVTLCLALVTPAHAATPMDHHAMAGMDMGLVPIPGKPGLFTVQSLHGPMTVRAATYRANVTPDFIITATSAPYVFDSDNNAATAIDTLTITQGQTVRWSLVSGTHTVTNGTGSADPNAGTLFNASLAPATPTFDFTFNTVGTVPYFCVFHESLGMKGVIIVNPPASVPGGPVAARTGFARPPAPNPTRGDITFAIGMAHDGAASLVIVDATGRRVATVVNGTLSAGEHTLRWDGRAADGRAAAPGVYRAVLRAGSVSDTRAFTLLR